MKRLSHFSSLQKAYFSGPQNTLISWVKNGQGTPEVTQVVLGELLPQQWLWQNISGALSRNIREATMREEAIQEHLDGQNGSEHLLLLKQHPQYSLEKSCLTETTHKDNLQVHQAPFPEQGTSNWEGKKPPCFRREIPVVQREGRWTFLQTTELLALVDLLNGSSSFSYHFRQQLNYSMSSSWLCCF